MGIGVYCGADMLRAKQKTKKQHTIYLGVQEINHLVNLAKGRIYSSQADWFYRLFLDRPETPENFQSIYDVREALSQAWWVEPEDVIQQIFLFMEEFRQGKTYGFDRELLSIAYRLRDWLLLREKLLIRDESRLALYHYQLQLDMTNTTYPEKGLDFVIDSCQNLALFDKYLLYLSDLIQLPNQEIGQILQCSTSRAAVLKFQTMQRIKKMEKTHAGI